MGELGEQLRTAREEKGLSLEEVAEATRIPLTYLEALEQETLETFTSDLHARGFLRNYASFLELDPEETTGRYDQLRGSSRTRTVSPLATPSGTRRTRWSTLGTDLLFGLVIVAVLALSAYSVYVRQNHIEPTPTPDAPSTPTATPMPVYEGTSYTIDVFLDYAQHHLDVQQRIDFTNVTSQTLPDLVLNVHSNCSRGTFELDEVRLEIDGEWVQPEVFPLDVTLRVALPRELRPDEHVALQLDYGLSLPKISPDAEFSRASLGYSKRAVSLGNWYPVIAPFREDKGWYGLTCFEYGDPYVTEVADYSVTITATAGVTVAGSGQETRQGNGWHYEIDQARSFAFTASDKYEVATAAAGDDVTMHHYYFANNAEAAEAALSSAVQSFELLTELYGAYPYADYRIAETEFAGGMEFSGLTFLGSVFYDQYDGTTRTPLIPLTVHEVSHQWFYGIVGNDQVAQPWLDEAPAEYTGFLYYERYLPDDADWWWSYAVEQWAPTGIIDARIHEFRSNRDYMDSVYRRGAQFMHELRETMGDPAFFGFLKEYQRRFAHQLVSSRDFFGLVQEFTTANLMPLQEEYFRQRILP